MPTQYRVELSKTNRATCKDTLCKTEGIKIGKGELRFGTWVEIQEHGSWVWKHWGCVSGAQVVNLQEIAEKAEGSYDWGAIDGYDELEEHPELQAMIRRVVTQGHIDDEDFKGDLEFNKPGQKGIRGRAKKTKAKDGDDEAAPSEGGSPVKEKKGKAAGGKRGRKTADADEDDEQPAAKKAKTPTGAKGKRGAKKVKDEDNEEEVEPAPSKAAAPKEKRASKKAVKTEPEDEVPAVEPVTKGRRARKAAAPKIKPEPQFDDEDDGMDEPERDDDAGDDDFAAPKENTDEDEASGVPTEPSDEEEEEPAPKKRKDSAKKNGAKKPAPKKAAPKGKRGSKKVAEIDEGDDMLTPEEDDVPEPVAKKAAGRGRGKAKGKNYKA